MKSQRRRNENDHCRILPSRYHPYSPDRSRDPMLMKTISSMGATPRAKRLWEKLQDVTVNEQAWAIIEEVIEDEIEKAFEEHSCTYAVGTKGVEEKEAPIPSDERTRQAVPEEQKHFVGDECPGGHFFVSAIITDIHDPYEALERED